MVNGSSPNLFLCMATPNNTPMFVLYRVLHSTLYHRRARRVGLEARP